MQRRQSISRSPQSRHYVLPDAIVVNEASLQLYVWRQGPQRGDRMPDVTELIMLSATLKCSEKLTALSLSAKSDRASSSARWSVFWKIKAVMATPRTLPRERIRYTVDADAACSIEVSSIRHAIKGPTRVIEQGYGCEMTS